MLLFQFYSWNNHSERLNDLPNFSKLVGRRVRIIEVFLNSHCASGLQEQVLSTQLWCAVRPPQPHLIKDVQVQWQLCCLSRALHDLPALHSISSLDSPSHSQSRNCGFPSGLACLAWSLLTFWMFACMSAITSTQTTAASNMTYGSCQVLSTRWFQYPRSMWYRERRAITHYFLLEKYGKHKNRGLGKQWWKVDSVFQLHPFPCVLPRTF